jgi:hypothetical protein
MCFIGASLTFRARPRQHQLVELLGLLVEDIITAGSVSLSGPEQQLVLVRAGIAEADQRQAGNAFDKDALSRASSASK